MNVNIFWTTPLPLANRGCSIRLGRDTEKNGKGYLPSTTLVWQPTLEAEAISAQKLAFKV
ncbi:hypothetical protein LINPERPRIM_LOCUS42092 [Linum perenne]